jgi:hypothetical protein
MASHRKSAPGRDGRRFYARVEDAGNNQLLLFMEFDGDGPRETLPPLGLTRGYENWVARQFAEESGFTKVTWVGPNEM